MSERVWGDTEDLEIDVIAREDQGDWSLGGTFDDPFAVAIGSSNGALIVTGDAEDLIKWAEKLTTKIREETNRRHYPRVIYGVEGSTETTIICVRCRQTMRLVDGASWESENGGTECPGRAH